MSVILINYICSLENSFGFESLFFGDLNFGMGISSFNSDSLMYSVSLKILNLRYDIFIGKFGYSIWLH